MGEPVCQSAKKHLRACQFVLVKSNKKMPQPRRIPAYQRLFHCSYYTVDGMTNVMFHFILHGYIIISENHTDSCLNGEFYNPSNGTCVTECPCGTYGHTDTAECRNGTVTISYTSLVNSTNFCRNGTVTISYTSLVNSTNVLTFLLLIIIVSLLF